MTLSLDREQAALTAAVTSSGIEMSGGLTRGDSRLEKINI
jgi:hypothetical protein